MITRAMVDIEGLDIRPSTVILSIGAVVFDHTGFINSFHCHVDIDSCVGHGLTVSGRTIRWWMEQSEEARRKVFQQDGVSLPRALRDFGDAFDWGNIDEVWANGTDYDIAALRYAHKACNMNVPWSYHKVRDYRTVHKLSNVQEIEPTVDHDALADAIAQAHTLRAILAERQALRSVT